MWAGLRMARYPPFTLGRAFRNGGYYFGMGGSSLCFFENCPEKHRSAPPISGKSVFFCLPALEKLSGNRLDGCVRFHSSALHHSQILSFRSLYRHRRGIDFIQLSLLPTSLAPGKKKVNEVFVLIIWILDLRACFGFRASYFEFIGPLVPTFRDGSSDHRLCWLGAIRPALCLSYR